MRRILIVNGPNLNLLGSRQPDIYGSQTLVELTEHLTALARDLKIELEFFQSNSEGAIVDFIQSHAPKAQGMVLNAGALAHQSHVLRDTIAAVGLETIEVHLTNLYARESFRHTSLIAPVCRGQICGFGFYGYAMALSYFADTTKSA